jgi:integrase
MIDMLAPAGKRRWELIDRLVDKSMSVPEMYDIYLEEGRDLDRVVARLEDVDLEPLVKEWIKNPGGKAKAGSDTAAHYEYHVRSLIPKGERFSLHQFTTAVIQQHIEELDAKPATKRKAGAAISSFAKWLFRRSVLKTKPMRDVELPAAGEPRVLFLETADAIRLADAQPGQYKNFSALLAGSGIEVSVALNLRRRDVDAKNREIRAAGTKTHSRDRMVRVADWAWGYVEELLGGKHPDARIFDQIPDRWRAADVHTDAIDSLIEKKFTGYTGYTMRDHRHTYAVFSIRAGVPPEVVARQLGHANAVLVHKVYGRFEPKQEERDKWARVASKYDADRREEAK